MIYTYYMPTASSRSERDLQKKVGSITYSMQKDKLRYRNVWSQKRLGRVCVADFHISYFLLRQYLQTELRSLLGTFI